LECGSLLPPSLFFQCLSALQKRQQAAALQGLRLNSKNYAALGGTPALTRERLLIIPQPYSDFGIKV
jgi:hypothetical protein